MIKDVNEKGDLVRQLTIEKVKNYVLIVLAISVLIGGPILWKEKVNDKRQYELFLNHFYHEIDMAISSMNYALSLDPEPKDREIRLTNTLYLIEKRLERMSLMTKAGHLLVNDDIWSQKTYFMYRGIPEFGEDGEIDETEANYLRELKKELETIRKGMYSDKTGQENPNLTIEQFNEIINKARNNSELLN